MKWTPEAEAAIKKVPFFVRKRVRSRVEKEAAEAGKNSVSIAEVKATQQRYLKNMSSEVKGYQLDGCFGPNGCPNRTARSDRLMKRLEETLENARLLDFLKQQVGENRLKLHHEFRVTLAECPNACSQPQIKDIGIIGACAPVVTGEPCSGCGTCEKTCPDDAVTVSGETVILDYKRCMACGRCAAECPTGTLAKGQQGYRVLLGGKLGRHPRLAREIPGIFSEEEVLDIVRACIDFFKQKSRGGQRFAQILTDADFNQFVEQFSKQKEVTRCPSPAIS